MAHEHARVRIPAAPDRRPVARAVASERRPAPAVPLARQLQQRLGNEATRQLVARSALTVGGACPVAARTPSGVQAFGTVSSPHDAAEIEAVETARKVVRMSGPIGTPAVAHETPAHAARASTPTASRAAPPSAPAGLAAHASGGAALPAGVRGFMEQRFGARFDGVRLHTDSSAAQLSEQLNAHAFTVGQHVFFGKDRFQPDTPAGKELIAHELTHTIQQGAVVQRSEDTTVAQRSPPRIQRLGISDALDYFADKANIIPGFRMFTIVLGVNPINMSAVERSPANILRALVEFIPGGGLIVQALEGYGIFEKIGAWIEPQIRALGMTGTAIRQAINAFLDSLSWSDIFDLGGVWERAKRIFTAPIDRIIDFAKSVVTGILGFIRDAILMPLARLAQGTRGYDLLCAVLGQDPISGAPVPRTPETLIGGFMKFIGEEQIWENVKKSNAIPRAWAWFQGALAGLIAFLRQIPTLFMNALRALEIIDLVLPPKAFVKLIGVFGGFAIQFVTWAGNAVWNLLEIIFDVVSPGALAYIKRTGAALKSILKNPLPFVGNLVKAAKLGFLNFADHFLEHLKAGLIDWLTGSLPGIYIPKAFTLAEIVKFVFSVLGLSWANIRLKLVKVVGEPAVKAMEAGFDIVVTLVTQGPAAAWDKIKEQLANLRDMVIGGITDFVVDMVVKKAVPKLISMFIPGAGFISAILSIYDTIMVFVNKLAKIAQVVKGFVDSIVAIAGGAIAAAAGRVETTLAGLLSLAINFLAGFAGLGKVADKVMAVIEKVRAPIDKALDWLVNWIVTMAKKLFAAVFGKKEGDKKDDKRDFRVRAKEELAGKFSGKMTRAKMQSAIQEVYAKYQAEGLKGITAKHPSGHGSQYEAVLIASSIPVSTAEADFDIDASDLDLGWGRTVATATVKAGAKTRVFGPYRNDGTNHAEENLLADLKDNWSAIAQARSTGITNVVVFNITRSPCGDMPKAHNCASQIRQFVANKRSNYLIDVEVRAASIYHGKFRKASREAIKKLADAGIKFTAWDLIAEMGDDTEVDKETLAKLQKRIDSTKEALPDIIKVGAGP